MRERQITDAALATKVRCSVRLIAYLKAGRRPTQDIMVDAIAHALGVDAAILTARVLEVVAGDRGAFFVNARKEKTSCSIR